MARQFYAKSIMFSDQTQRYDYNVNVYERIIVHAYGSIEYTSYKNVYKSNLKLYESTFFEKQINIPKQLWMIYSIIHEYRDS